MLTLDHIFRFAIGVFIVMAVWALARSVVKFLGRLALNSFAKRKGYCHFCYLKPRSWVLTDLDKYPDDMNMCSTCMEEKLQGPDSIISRRWIEKGKLVPVDDG